MKPVLVRKPTAEEEALLKAQPTWEHEPEKWRATYDEREETCLVIEGSAYVETLDGEKYPFGVGDLVTFQPGLECWWCVEEKIKKHYIFDLGYMKQE